MTSGDVNELGFDESRLQRVTDTLTQQINSGYIHGAMMRVSRRGQIVVDFMDGYAEKASGRRLERDSVFVTMSVAKPFTSVLILSLVERGLLRLHSPVAEILPEFGKWGKETITLFHLLTHTGGMMSGAPNTTPDVLTNIEKLVELLGNLPAECLPGERVSYSMLVAHSVLAAMCLKVDGRGRRSEEHTSELQSLMRISYAVFCLKKKNNTNKLQIPPSN